MIYNGPFNETFRNLFTSNATQGCNITFHGTDVSYSGTITEKDMCSGGLTVDRMVVSGSAIEIGTAIASELTLSIRNSDGTFNNVHFEGSELYVEVTVSDDDGTYPVPLGYFTVDKPTRPLSNINIVALDRMVNFDIPVDWSSLTFPMTVGALLSDICGDCNVPLHIDGLSDLPNYSYQIPARPEAENITYRQLVQWVAEITATCAFIDCYGELRLMWYDYGTNYSNIAATFTTANRYSSDLYENDIMISGVRLVDNASNAYTIGSQKYAINIAGNGLIQSDYENIAAAIANKVIGFSYRPYEAVTRPMPFLYPLDTVNFVDRNGNNHYSIITNTTFTMNRKTAVKGQGETDSDYSYATQNPLSKREQAIMREIRKIMNETLNSRDQSVIHFNEMIANSMGVYTTVQTLEDGSQKYYMHDRPRLEDSITIYTQNANGYAYTNSGWHGDDTVWQYGLTKDGNAILNKVNAEGIEVAETNSPYSINITPGIFAIYYGAVTTLELQGDTAYMPKIKSEQMSLEPIRVLKHFENGIAVGLNIVYVSNGEEES